MDGFHMGIYHAFFTFRSCMTVDLTTMTYENTYHFTRSSNIKNLQRKATIDALNIHITNSQSRR